MVLSLHSDLKYLAIVIPTLEKIIHAKTIISPVNGRSSKYEGNTSKHMKKISLNIYMYRYVMF